MNLRGANLSGANLRGANLSGANLIEANLVSTDLSEANFEGADLYNSNLYKANLENANLCKTNLCEAQVLGANFKRAVLTGACIQNLQIRNSTNFNQVRCDYIFRKYDNELQHFTDRFPRDPNSILLPDEFSQSFRDIINKSDSSAKIEINISDEFKVAFKQYLVFFEEFVREVKSRKIIFEVLSVSDGLEILIEAHGQEELIEISSYLHEYVSLIGKSSHEMHISFEKDVNYHQAEMSLIELRSQLRNLKTSLEIKEVKLSYQNDFISYLKDLVDKLQHSLALKNQNQHIIISNSTNDSNVVSIGQENSKVNTENQSSGDTYHVGQAGAVGKGARSDGNIFIQSEQKQNLVEAAIEIQNLLKQLEKSNPDATLEDKKAFVNAGVSSTIKQKAISAFKSGGQATLLELLDNPYVNVVMAVINGWCEG